MTQTADALFGTLDLGWFPALRVVFDGRNRLRDLPLPAGVAYCGVGIAPRPAEGADSCRPTDQVRPSDT